ncbi:SNF2 helicase, putative [Bodo saltans]|uniref:SNF2 helicase, putative n=1 Tax=Bodo saltans TaxID=75058 RepID=A0A0S4ITM5_BODSA|nr:SNF2 helicase, putative [Bodo saltans]|eukprot:CUF79758.1 SNF2 helicase, putative [Bodo saltans]
MTQGIPRELQVLLNKCTEYGVGIAQQLREEHDHGIRCADSREEFFLKPRHPPSSSSTQPSSAAPQPPMALHPHQVDGIRWLLAIFKNAVNGILADDMGLGKTVQVIGFLSALYGQRYFGTHLIVVPLSTLDNWKREFEKWCPWLPLVTYHGNKDFRTGMRTWLKRRYHNSWKHQPAFTQRNRQGEAVESLVKEVGCVVLTTFDMVMADAAALCKLIPWDILIVDEAHRLKNFDCKLLKCLRKCQTEGRLLLTGTPLQNNVKELWSMLNFVVPTLFDDVDEFSGWFRQAELVSAAATAADSESASSLDASAQSARNQSNHCDSDGGELIDPAVPTLSEVAQAVECMHAALRPFILRRTKAEIVNLNLPPKVEIVIYTPLTANQIRFYEAMKLSDAFSNNRMMQLRKLCCHPMLFPDSKLQDLLVSHSARNGSNNNFVVDQRDLVRTKRDSRPAESSEQQLRTLLQGSSKFQMLDKMLRHLLPSDGDRARAGGAGAHKILIFSQMTKVLDLIENYFQLLQDVAKRDNTKTTRRTKVSSGSFVIASWVRLDGTSSLDERIASIDQFNGSSRDATKKRLREDGDEIFPACVVNGNVDDLSIFHSPPTKPLLRPDFAPPQHDIGHAENDDCNEVGGPSVFLISTRSGGVGLNLVAADTVILFDCDFNPHNDQQAIDRCHRIGQVRPVAVYRLVAPSTVEEALMCVALRKKKMEKVVIECGQFRHSSVTGAGATSQSQDSDACNHKVNTSPKHSVPHLSRFLFDESLAINDFDLDDFAPKLTIRQNSSSNTSYFKANQRVPPHGAPSDDALVQALTMRMTFGHCHVMDDDPKLHHSARVQQQKRQYHLSDEEFRSLMNREQLVCLR